MTIELRTPRQVDLIVLSINKVMETGDINNLTKIAYNYLYLCSGFIAHTNLFGFRDEYADVEQLRAHILRFQKSNQYSNFRHGEHDYDYYMEKKNIYNRICAAIDLSAGQEDESYTDPCGVNYQTRF